MKPGFSFFSKREYDELEPTPWLDANGRRNNLSANDSLQDQPGEKDLVESSGDLGIKALIYGQVQLYGQPKPKREPKHYHNNAYQHRPKLSVSFDDQPPVVINSCEPVVGGMEEKGEPEAEPQPVHDACDSVDLPETE